MGIGGVSIWQLLVMLFFFLVLVLPFWHIFKKAGYSPWFSLFMLIPLVNLVTLYFLAFAAWPALSRP
jgi:hypothetical protein